MALNPIKSVASLYGTSQRLKSLSWLKSVNIVGAVIPLSDKVKIHGATLNANLTMAPHVKAFIKLLVLSHSFLQANSSIVR